MTTEEIRELAIKSFGTAFGVETGNIYPCHLNKVIEFAEAYHNTMAQTPVDWDKLKGEFNNAFSKDFDDNVWNIADEASEWSFEWLREHIKQLEQQVTSDVEKSDVVAEFVKLAKERPEEEKQLAFEGFMKISGEAFMQMWFMLGCEKEMCATLENDGRKYFLSFVPEEIMPFYLRHHEMRNKYIEAFDVIKQIKQCCLATNGGELSGGMDYVLQDIYKKCDKILSNQIK